MTWSTTDQDVMDPEFDELDAADEVEEAPAAVVADDPSPKTPRKARKRSAAGAGNLTKAQVSHVIAVRDSVEEASGDARNVLAAIFRTSAEVEELTIATVTVKLEVDPLQDIVALREAAAENPMMAPAMVAGMESRSRVRMNQVLCAITGGDESDLPKDDLKAAVHLAQVVAGLSHADSILIDEVLELRG